MEHTALNKDLSPHSNDSNQNTMTIEPVSDLPSKQPHDHKFLSFNLTTMKSGLINNSESRDTLPNRSSLSRHSFSNINAADQ